MLRPCPAELPLLLPSVLRGTGSAEKPDGGPRTLPSAPQSLRSPPALWSGRLLAQRNTHRGVSRLIFGEVCRRTARSPRGKKTPRIGGIKHYSCKRPQQSPPPVLLLIAGGLFAILISAGRKSPQSPRGRDHGVRNLHYIHHNLFYR